MDSNKISSFKRAFCFYWITGMAVYLISFIYLLLNFRFKKKINCLTYTSLLKKRKCKTTFKKSHGRELFCNFILWLHFNCVYKIMSRRSQSSSYSIVILDTLCNILNKTLMGKMRNVSRNSAKLGSDKVFPTMG